MTYIEFYDRTAVENISACLTFKPDKVILIGNNLNQLLRSKAVYEQVAAEHGLNVVFDHEVVPRSHLELSLEILQKIVDENEDCVFDLSGGEEVLSLALGMICERNPHRNIQLHKFDLRSNRVFDCDANGNEIEIAPPSLSVRDQIRIYGGDIVYGDVHSPNTYLWDLNEQFRRDFEKIWDVCKQDVEKWNDQIGVVAKAAEIGKHSDDRLTVVAPINVLDYQLRRSRSSYQYIPEVVEPLLEKGLLTHYEDDGQKLTVSFKDPQVKRCLIKAGQALELKIYMTARELREEDGSGEPVYSDSLTGVVIDWDGKFHDPQKGPLVDTINEIDVLLMHDVMPVFISCKNGTVDADELYKLSTVSERFGSDYAKMVLVVNGLTEYGDAGRYLRQRMTDMSIRRIERVQDMTDEQLRERLRTLWK